MPLRFAGVSFFLGLALCLTDQLQYRDPVPTNPFVIIARQAPDTNVGERRLHEIVAMSSGEVSTIGLARSKKK